MSFERFPRTRGDVAYLPLITRRQSGVPPHTRGCRGRNRQCAILRRGSLAYAGMSRNKWCVTNFVAGSHTNAGIVFSVESSVCCTSGPPDTRERTTWGQIQCRAIRCRQSAAPTGAFFSRSLPKKSPHTPVVAHGTTSIAPKLQRQAPYDIISIHAMNPKIRSPTSAGKEN